MDLSIFGVRFARKTRVKLYFTPHYPVFPGISWNPATTVIAKNRPKDWLREKPESPKKRGSIQPVL
jgi:hypothetical protein